MIEEKHGKGSCFCGTVRYTFTFTGLSSSVCHCDMCRALHGSDYTTWVTVSEDAFSLVNGEESITSYQVSDHTMSHFCSLCGTKVYSVDSRYCNVGILRGTIETEIDELPRRQWFWDKKVSWLNSLQNTKKFTGETAEPVDGMT